MYQAAIDNVSAKGLIRASYDNFIGGKWVAPVEGRYFDNPSPITGEQAVRRSPRSTRRRHRARARRRPQGQGRLGQDLGRRALADPQQASPTAWSRTSTLLALVETLDNGKPIRETTYADLPLCVDHWRYFAGALRAQEGALSEIDHDTIAYHFQEPLGVVGQIIPWNFPLLMAVWKLAPALAAGNCVVLKPAEQTPLSHSRAGRADRRPAARRRAQHRQRLRPRGRQAARVRASASPRSPSPARRRRAG